MEVLANLTESCTSWRAYTKEARVPERTEADMLSMWAKRKASKEGKVSYAEPLPRHRIGHAWPVTVTPRTGSFILKRTKSIHLLISPIYQWINQPIH